MRSRLHLRFRDAVLATGTKTFWTYREDLARRYLVGEGIEIGPLTKPLRLPRRARVRYVDRMSREDLFRVEGPNLVSVGDDPSKIPGVDIVDEADRLASIADSSVDFVIANHVLEHVEDPIGALEHLLRVLRPGGTLFLVLPDARYTFDATRPRTTIEHLLRDHREGPQVSRRLHYEEWARLIECVPEEHVADRVAQFADEDVRHHFHVWELRDFLAFLLALDLEFEIVHAQAYLEEFAVILRKPSAQVK